MTQKTSPTFLKPRNNLIFKRLFGTEKNTDILIGLLTSVLSIPKEELEGITILNPETTIEKENDKRGILDLFLHTKCKDTIHVELQVDEDPSMRSRLLFYVSKKYGDQLISGDDYDELKRMTSILITGFELTESSDYHNVYKLINIKTGEMFSEDLEIHTLEYKKLPVEEDGSTKYNWLKFIKAESMEELEMLKDKDEAIFKAIEALELLSQDPRMRIEYDARERDRMRQVTNERIFRERAQAEGHAAGHAVGLEEGANEKAVVMVKKLVDKGMSLMEALEIAELSEEDFNNIT